MGQPGRRLRGAPRAIEPSARFVRAPAPLRAPVAASVDRPIGAVPRSVAAEAVTALSVGVEHACVVHGGGRVSCWGVGGDYRLGNRGVEMALEPLPIPWLDRVISVAAGGLITCAVRADRTVVCWGGNRRVPRVDWPDWPAQDAPVTVAHPVAWTRSVSVGWNRVGLLDAAGEVSIVDAYEVPVPLVDFVAASSIAMLSSGLCTLGADGRAECNSTTIWSGGGDGKDYHVGDPRVRRRVLQPLSWSEELRPLFFDAGGKARSAPCSPSPGEPSAAFCSEYLSGATQLDAHDNVACAVLRDGGVACWQSVRFDESSLGFPPGLRASVPFRVAGVSEVARVAVGGAHVCTLHVDGTVRCWGADRFGQLGPLGRGDTSTPTVIPDLGEVTQIDAGVATTCALSKDGVVRCWGHVLGTRFPERIEPIPPR